MAAGAANFYESRDLPPMAASIRAAAERLIAHTLCEQSHAVPRAGVRSAQNWYAKNAIISGFVTGSPHPRPTFEISAS